MSFEEKIDKLLIFIREETQGKLRGNFSVDDLLGAVNELDLGGDEKTQASLSIIFNQLAVDGLVAIVESSGKPQYSITGKGLLFEGYQNRRNRYKKEDDAKKSLEDYHKTHIHRMGMLTGWIAFGTVIMAIYSIFEIYWHYRSCCH